MDQGSIHIGTSGWSYKHWKEIYYPPKMKPADYLSFYAQSFEASEINASFYRLPVIETVAKWVEKVPPGFRFCPKFSKYLTHMKKLHDPEEPLERFFSVFEPMLPLLGPVLVQLPPHLPFNYHLAEHFFTLLQGRYHRHVFALEIRHPTWLEDNSLDLMARHGIAFVISQSGDAFPYSEMVTARTIYVRFHGPAQLYASSYSDVQLEEYARKFTVWMAEGHQIWVFFNNDIGGHAITDARRLKRMMGQEGTTLVMPPDPQLLL